MTTKITRKTISGTTDASGNSTVYSNNVAGKLKNIKLDIDGLDNTADITITTDGEAVAQTLYSKSNSATNVVVYPRVAVQDNAGADVTFDGTNEIYDDYVLVGRFKVVVAQGGNTKAFKITFDVEEY